MKITTIGLDVAKNVMQIHGVDEHGKVAVKKQLKRSQVAEYFVNLRRAWWGWKRAAERMSGRAS